MELGLSVDELWVVAQSSFVDALFHGIDGVLLGISDELQAGVGVCEEAISVASQRREAKTTGKQNSDCDHDEDENNGSDDIFKSSHVI